MELCIRNLWIQQLNEIICIIDIPNGQITKPNVKCMISIIETLQCSKTFETGTRQCSPTSNHIKLTGFSIQSQHQ